MTDTTPHTRDAADPVLSYRRPVPSFIARREPNPVLAMILCLPGLICWIQLALMSLVDRWPINLRMFRLSIQSDLILWGVAVVTAIISYFAFANKFKRWYVVLCLVINTLGLLYTAFMLAVLLSIISH